MSWIEILTIANFVVALCVIIGGYIGIRSGIARTASDISKQVREDLEAENTLLKDRVKRLEVDNKRLNRRMTLLISILKKAHSIEVEINDDIITVRSQG